MRRKTKTYVWSIGLTLAVGALSALLTMGNMDVYEDISKPYLSPPGFLFPIVWTILYTLMGISLANVIIKGRENGISSLSCVIKYTLQLVVNFFWSIIFFNMRAFLFSFVWLCLLWVLILIMMTCFYRISRSSAYINIPYLLWVTFAGYLNYMIYILN